MSLTESWADRFEHFFQVEHSHKMIKAFFQSELQQIEMDVRQECLRSEGFRLNKLLLRQVEQCISVISDAAEPLDKEAIIAAIRRGLL